MKLKCILALLAAACSEVPGRAQTSTMELLVTEPAAVDEPTRAVLERHFAAFEVVRLDYQPLADALSRGVTRHRMHLGEIVNEELLVELRDLRSPNYKLFLQDGSVLRQTEPRSVPNTYILRDARGVERGRLNIDRDLFEARVWGADEELYDIRQLSRLVATGDANGMVMTKVADATSDQAGICGTEDKAVLGKVETRSASGGFEHCVQLEIAGAGDHTLFNQHGIFGTEKRVFEVINMAESIYMNKFGLPFTVTGNVVSIAPDPYTSSDSGTLLAQFKDHWNDLGVDIKRDIAMLVSGKNLDGGTKGRAFTGVAGLPDRAYAIVQSPGTDHLDFVVAHEIGHSLDADHDGSGCAHLLSGNRWIMCSWVGSKDFSGTSIDAIVNYVNNNLDLFISEYTLTTNPFYIDGQFTHGELHAGNSIVTENYYLQDPTYDVTLLARKKIVLKANTFVTDGARLVCRIVPDLDCTAFGNR